MLSTKLPEFQEYSPTFYKPHTLKSLSVLLILLFALSQSNFLESMAERFSLTDSGKDSTTTS